MGTIWGLRRGADGTLTGPEVLVRRPGSLISSFGEANDGTLFVTTFEGGERPGPGAITGSIRSSRPHRADRSNPDEFASATSGGGLSAMRHAASSADAAKRLPPSMLPVRRSDRR